MRINATLASAQHARPAYPYGQLATVPLEEDEKVGILRAAVPADVPDNATVTLAELVFHTREAWSGAVEFTALRQDEPWSVSKVTWNNRPDTVVGSGESVTVTSPAVGDEFRIDVTAHVQAFVAGSATNRGWRITTDAGTARDIYGATAGKHKPYLEIEYVIPGDAPTGLVPDGAAVSIAKPTLTFPVADDTVAIRIQIDNDANGTSPAFDTNTANPTGFPSTVGLFDLAASAYAGLADGATTYWRAWQKGPLGWSLPSDWATLHRVTKPTVTITSPGATTGDKTPPITWTSAGQVTWHTRLLRPDGTVLDDSTRTTSADDEWTPDTGLRRVGQIGRVHVRTWDDVDRVATPGDPIWSETYFDFELVAIDDAPGLDALTATQVGPSPVVRLAWEGPVADRYRITRDGEWLDLIDGSEDTYLDCTASPLVQHAYRVLSVTDDGDVSPHSPYATITPFPAGAWLIDPDTGDAVLILDDDVATSMPERAVLHQPVGDAPPVRRRSGTPPPFGHTSGLILDSFAGDDYAAADMAAIALRFKVAPQRHVYRLVWGAWNRPVTIGDMNVAPLRTENRRPAYSIDFDWWHTGDELPWDD